MNLEELRASVRDKADEESDGFITNASLDRSINQAHRWVYAKLVQKFEGRFVIPGTVGDGGVINTQNGVTGYDLPTGIVKIVRVEGRSYGSTSQNDYRQISPLSISSYRLPETGEPISARIWYVPSAKKLVNLGDETVTPAEYDDLISEYACALVLRKSGEGIFKESIDMLNMEISGMLENSSYFLQAPERMIISGESYREDLFYGNSGNEYGYIVAGNKIYIGHSPNSIIRGW